jgi:hypothetical protein
MKKTGTLLLAAILFLAAAGWLNQHLFERRQTLSPSVQNLGHATPLVAFTTVALGGFRGILADLLWLRVVALQDAGRYFEITQLADWITKLEPTFTEVWSFHAWNMAYNIGFLFDDPADRWRWVENGIRMLRDGGLRYNPENPRLYWELGWMYLNKVGSQIDNAAGYYQRRLYQAMEPVVPGGFLKDGPPHPALQDQFRMDPAAMARVDQALGPLDWRLPESHAVYWAWLGREKTKGLPDLSLERLLYQSMIVACLRGRLVALPEQDVEVRLARLDLFLPTLRLMDEAVRLYPDDGGIRVARHFLMRMAIFQFYAHGMDEPARRLFDQYRIVQPLMVNDLGAFVVTEVAGKRLVTAGQLAILEALFFEAEIQRLQGKASVAERMDSLAALNFENLDDETRIRNGLTITLYQLREQAQSKAKRVMQASQGKSP